VCRKSSSVTWRVPSYPFVSVACSGGERMYVRLRSEQYFEQQVCGLSAVNIMRSDRLALRGRTGFVIPHSQYKYRVAQRNGKFEIIRKKNEGNLQNFI
jgi:hypothetical protein